MAHKSGVDIYTNFFKAMAKSVFEGNFQETEPIKIKDTAV